MIKDNDDGNDDRNSLLPILLLALLGNRNNRNDIDPLLFRTNNNRPANSNIALLLNQLNTQQSPVATVANVPSPNNFLSMFNGLSG